MRLEGGRCTYPNAPEEEREKPLAVRLEGSQISFLNPSNAILFLQSGDFYSIQFVRDGRSLSKLRVEYLGVTVVPSVAELVGKQHLFLGSLVGDSVLFRATVSAAKRVAVSVDGMAIDDVKPPVETSASNDAQNSNAMDVDEDEDDLYGGSLVQTGRNDVSGLGVYGDFMTDDQGDKVDRVEMDLCDTLFGYGPIRGMAVGAVAKDVSQYLPIYDSAWSDTSLWALSNRHPQNSSHVLEPEPKADSRFSTYVSAMAESSFR